MWFFKKKKQESKKQVEAKPDVVIAEPKPLSIDEFTLSSAVNPEEMELVSLITSCIAASDQSLSKYKIKSIKEIDTEKELAAALVGAILAQDRPSSQFRLVRIEER